MKEGGVDGKAAGLSRVRKFDRPIETHNVAIEETAISARKRPPTLAIRPEKENAALSVMSSSPDPRREATRAALCGGTSAAKWCFRGIAAYGPFPAGGRIYLTEM